MIIDFYYKYYLYLLGKEKIQKARDILHKLYEKQKEFKARVYSPFVEMELSAIEREKDNLKGAIAFLQEAINSSRSIKNSDYAKIYYEMAKLYKKMDEPENYDETVAKCKGLSGIDDNIYKKMCDKL